MTDFKPLTVDAYARAAAVTDQRSDDRTMSFALLGLVGETGSLLSEAKKKQRDRASYLGYADAVVEELGDVLWYLAAIARRGRFPLSAIAQAALDPDSSRAAALPDLTFHDLQPAHMPLGKEPSAAFERTLLSLASEVGLLVQDQQAVAVPDRNQRRARLAGVLRLLIQAANEASVTIEAAAIKNSIKIADRWPSRRTYPSLFDDGLTPEESLPRRMIVDVFERTVGSQAYVFQQANGINIGDRLTDNAAEPDDYRFHDVFHYAYVAVLGWSPVMRSLLRLKRKSLPAIDEAQDGARAVLIEEGVTTWIFGKAQQLDFFEGVTRGGLPLDMLKEIRAFVAGYEVEQCPLWLWEEAVLQGYAAFRFLRERRRARIIIDVARRRLQLSELAA